LLARATDSLAAMGATFPPTPDVLVVPDCPPKHPLKTRHVLNANPPKPTGFLCFKKLENGVWLFIFCLSHI
jgi:hypothetical protein